MFRRSFAMALVCGLVGLAPISPAMAKNEPRVHVVYPGHTLGKISKRYHVSIELLCEVNGLQRNEAIRPGQKIVVPAKDDEQGREARKVKAQLDQQSKKEERSTRRQEPGFEPPRVHVVYPGHTLGKIARRYNVTIEALCHANDLKRTATLKPKQKLIVPARHDSDGNEARAIRARGNWSPERSGGVSVSWREYSKRPWRRGYVVLQSGDKTWKGYILGPHRTVLPNAVKNVSNVLASWRTGKRVSIDRNLILLIAQVSDTFGGRPIQVVSGFREHSYVPSSKHPRGRALDFAIAGVPNEAIRDYLRSLPRVGVGYYPNSTFVHMDVRETSTHWVDTSEPGEPPEFAHAR